MGPKYRECLKRCEGVPLIHPIYWDFPLQTIHFPIFGNLQMTLPSAGDAFSWCRYTRLFANSYCFHSLQHQLGSIIQELEPEF